MKKDQFTLWLEQHSYARGTVRNYVGAVERADDWLRQHRGTPVERAKWEAIRDYGSTLPNTYATRSQLRNGLRSYWTYLGRQECPAWAVPCPRQPQMICRALEEGQVEKLLISAGELGHREHTACLLLYYQALRRAETAALPWAAFLGDGWMRIVGKGRKEARLPVHDRVAAAVAALERRDGGAHVFAGRKVGRPVSDATVNLWVRIAGAAAGLGRVTPHMLRHTALATANDRTGDLRSVQTFARHSSPRTTAGYTRTTERRLRDVLNSL